MRKLKIEPHSKNSGRNLNIIVDDYWYRSAAGFGSYTKEIAQNTFKRVAGNAKLYYASDDEGNRYKVKAQQLGRGFYIVIKPVEDISLQ